VEYHTNGGGGSWHANRRTSGQQSFEGSWILLLNNNSRELVPITDWQQMSSAAQSKMPLLPWICIYDLLWSCSCVPSALISPHSQYFMRRYFMPLVPLCTHRRLADGNVHCAGSATYQIIFRLPIPNLNPIPNPKPVTDPNPNAKINKKQNDTGMKLNIRVISKSRLAWL